MRDDLHKSAPVRAVWKRFLRSCIREAERGPIAEQRCGRALADDCNAELTPQFITELFRRAAAHPVELFGGKLHDVRSSLDLGGSGNVLEEQLLTRVRMSDDIRAFSSASLEDALTGVLTQRLSAMVTAVHGHVLREGGGSSGGCLSEIKRCAAAVSPRRVASELLANGGRIPVARRALPMVSLDENLLSQK